MKCFKFCQLYFIFLISIFGCKKFVDVNPPITALVGSSVFDNNETAAAAVSGLLQNVSISYGSSLSGGANGISVLLGLSSDELMLYPTSNTLYTALYTNSLTSSQNPAPPAWNDLYNFIYQANAAIEGISSSSGVTVSMRNQLLGETKFIRAICYFYLTNIYGDVPLTLTSNYQQNSSLSNSTRILIYAQIAQDLKDAQNLLSNNYLTPTGASTSERARPNRGAASALLARVYLFTGDWANAEAEADSVINNSGLYSLVSNLNSVFLVNSKETIWQLEQPSVGFNAPDASVFLVPILLGGPSDGYPVMLSDSLVNDFEVNDLRRVDWVDSVALGSDTYYYPYKYNVYYSGAGAAAQQVPVVLRLAEQFLIRAEAEAEQNKLGGAIGDLNVIRNRAGISSLPSTLTQSQVLAAVLNERRYELFSEYGHRWMDLKRTGSINSVMSGVCTQKGGSWAATDSLYPIPLVQLQRDPNSKQNQGY